MSDYKHRNAPGGFTFHKSDLNKFYLSQHLSLYLISSKEKNSYNNGSDRVFDNVP